MRLECHNQEHRTPFYQCKIVKYQTSFLIALSHPLAGKQQLKVLNIPEFWGFQIYINTAFFLKEISHVKLQKVLYSVVLTKCQLFVYDGFVLLGCYTTLVGDWCQYYETDGILIFTGLM